MPAAYRFLLTVGFLFMPLATAHGQEPADLIDPAANPETVALWKRLHVSATRGCLFGQHNSHTQGLGWQGITGKCDIVTVSGQEPSICSFDLDASLTKTDETSAARVQEIHTALIQAHDRGAAVTLSWHTANPAGGGYRDHTPTSLTDVLPGKPHHGTMLAHIDGLADWLKSLTDATGRPIPILFRPWHEHTGGWFWWGCDSGSSDDYNALWRMTVKRLRDHHKLHHLIWVISPSTPHAHKTPYAENRFPGMDWVDVIGFDNYANNAKGTKDMGKDLLIVGELARKHGKLAAATEVGYRKGIGNYKGDDWYSGRLLPELHKTKDLPIAWVLTWRNHNEERYWVPVGNRRGVADFKHFIADDHIRMLDAWKAVEVRP